MKASRLFLNVQALCLPNKLYIVSPIIIEFYHYFSINILMIGYTQGKISWVSTIAKAFVILGYFLSSNVEGISCSDLDFLIFGSMIDFILSDKFYRAVSLISFENSYSSFGQRNSKSICVCVGELNFVACFEVLLSWASCIDRDDIVFSDLETINFRDELDLLLRVIIEWYWFT